MGERNLFRHLLAAFFLLVCSGIGFLPGWTSDDITDVPDTDHDSTRGLTRDLTRDPTKYSARHSTHDTIQDSTHDLTLDWTRDLTVDLTHDTTLDPTHDTTHDPTRDTTLDPTHDATHDPTHDATHDPTRSPRYYETSSFQNLETRNKSLGEKLSSYLDRISGIETLQKAYDDADKSGKITFGNVEGESLITEVAASLSNLLGNKVDALKAAVKHAEYLSENYMWNANLNSVGFLDAIDFNESAVESFEFDSQYNQLVSLENSSVHVPVDIYKKQVDIQNAIAWTDGLNEVWRANKEKNPSLLWQYFGSHTGILRTYPAAKWSDNSTMSKLYDVRRRPWYTQGISSPKDMLILIEKSGSSHGQGLELMKHSVRSIMETLGENDFVNIAQFSDQATFATCFRTFVQATDRNKRKMVSFLGEVVAGQVANYTKGFEFAFKQFANLPNNTENSSEGANCNQVIMLLTDGGANVPVETFRKYNSEKKIRVFTFAVGPVTGIWPREAEQIGCMNRGAFYQIPAMGAIRSKVQGYLSILTDPTALAVNSDIQFWTSVHRDLMHSGLAISVTMPVFNRSQELVNQTILGVMGVDVSIKELKDAVPLEKLGPTGYAFAINSNGIILFHPELNEENDITGPMVDFAELEQDTPSKEKIRTEMIDQISNKAIITDFVIGLDKNHADKKQRTYHYTAISGTKFSVAIVLPDYVKHYVESIQPIDFEKDGQRLLLSNFSKIVIDFQKYCSYIDPTGNLSSSPASTMEEFLSDILSNFSTCDSYKLQQLLFDAYITLSLEELWMSGTSLQKQDLKSDDMDGTDSKQNHNSSNIDDLRFLNTDDGIIAAFVSTNNDFTRVFPPSASDFFENQLEPSKEAYYKKSVDNDGWIFSIYPNSSSQNVTAHDVMATKAVSLQSINYKIAIVGVWLTAQGCHDLFESILNECSASDLSACYILDDGGFIVASSDDDVETSVGQFLGLKDPEVMEALLDDNIFERHRRLYFQEVCEEDDENSAGFRLFPSFLYDFLSLNWWTTASTWSYLSLMNIYSWLFVQIPDIVEAAKDPPKEVPCIKAMFQYHLNDADISNAIECNNCTRSYKASHLEGTNLLVVSVDGETCGCSTDVTFSNSETVSDPLIEESEGGNCSIRVRYRRRPPCYKDNPFEPESHCSASSLTTTAKLCLMLILSITLTQTL